MAEIGEKVNMQYNCVKEDLSTGITSGGSGPSTGGTILVRSGFTNMGYITAALGEDYNYNAISSEIYANRPVYAGGWTLANYQYNNTFALHAWVIDGVNQQMVIETVVQHCPWQPPVVVDTYFNYHNYVYCNLGAETPSNYNGFYLSDLFIPNYNNAFILTGIK